MGENKGDGQDNIHAPVRNSINNATLNMIFSVTYYLELCNAKIIYCTSHFFFKKR